ncbi:MAG: transporter [Verrucomicrobiia bacterium]
MKIRFVRIVMAAGLAALPGILQAQPSAQYVPGSEGIKGASLPPPGVYARDYNYFYWAGQFNGPSGNDARVPNADVFTYASIPRVIWITGTKFLGGYVGVDALLPLVDQHVRAGGFDGTTFGVGDFFGEGTLSWHLKQFDFAVGSGVWAPTGDSAPPPTTRIGAGYWTFMQTAGATWYIDEEKTWAVSALNRYEFSTEQRDTDVIPGQAYTLEWGVSKTVAKVVDLGAVGYYQQQVNPNSGESWSSRNRVAAVGPEVSVAFPKQMLFASLRYNYEFMAESRAQGNAVTLTLTKRF